MNRVLLSGRLAREPEMRTTRAWRGTPGSDRVRTATRLMIRTDADVLNPAPAIAVDVYDRLGETCAQYLVADAYIEVEGRLVSSLDVSRVAVDAAAGGVVRYVTSSRSRIARDFRAEVDAIIATKED